MAGGACGGTMVDGPMPPSAVWGAVWVARALNPCMTVGEMWVDNALPPCVAGGTMCVEGPLPPCVTTGPTWMVTMGGGNWLMTVCITVLGPLTTLWVAGCDVDMGPLAKVRLKNGSGFALAVGLDGAVWRFGSQ